MKNIRIKSITFILIFTSSFVFFSCKEKEKKQVDYEQYEQTLIDINRYLVKEDVERIESYIKRNEWDMQQTQTGLWYEIYENGNGEKAQEGKVATMFFTVELLDGTICYTSDSLGPKKFKLGFGNVETGLQEGVLMLREGDKARFILPPYMAHGLLGDEFQIPPLSIIVYHIELLEISE